MPPRKKEPLTDDEKFQLQLQQEHDLQRYQRQYMHLHRDRNLFCLGTKSQKQIKVLQIFQREHHNILTDLDVAGAPAKRKDDVRNCETLANSLVAYGIYGDEVAEKKKYIEEINDQIRQAKKEMVELEARQITDRQYEQRVWLARKTVEALENKLELQTRKFCGICSDNRIMREEINHFLHERQNFMKIWNKILWKLNVGKKYMLDLIEQATIAYDQREDWCSKLNALRMKAHQDFINHINEMRHLKRTRDDQQKLELFLNTKSQKRIMRDLRHNELIKRYELKQSLKKKMRDYQDMVNDITEFTGESEVDKIVTKFKVQESKNFSNFNVIIDMIWNMEGITDRLAELQADIDNTRCYHEAISEAMKMKLKYFEDKLNRFVTEKENLTLELATCDESLEKLMHGISALFKICKCSNDPLLKLLGGHQNIQWYNVMLYIDILESKVLESIAKLSYKEKIMEDKKMPGQRFFSHDIAEEVDSIITLEKVAKTNPCPLCVEYEMVSDVIDTVQCAYSRETAKKKLAERLARPDAANRVHNVSACHLPKSREIIQKRYT